MDVPSVVTFPKNWEIKSRTSVAVLTLLLIYLSLLVLSPYFTRYAYRKLEVSWEATVISLFTEREIIISSACFYIQLVRPLLN